MALVETRREGRVAVVTLNRPEALNAISSQVADRLKDAFADVSADRDVWAVILEAAGDRAFCVGADLKERAAFSDADWIANRHHIRDMFTVLRAVPQPTIAAVFGFALGGGFELALSCDLIVAADDAVIGLTEVRVGIIPGGGGTQLLARKAGLTQAKDLVMTGRRIGPEEAREMGLIARVTPRGELPEAAMALAGEICENAPIAVQEAKRAIERGLEVSVADGIEMEDQAWRNAVATKDRAEGIAAFVEKRTPNWSGE